MGASYKLEVRGRKLFICFQPSDTQYLHAFEGMGAMCLYQSAASQCALQVFVRLSQAETKWPEYWMATPYVGVLEDPLGLLLSVVTNSQSSVPGRRDARCSTRLVALCCGVGFINHGQPSTAPRP
eukprot:2176931-Amphidinium_carterae.1